MPEDRTVLDHLLEGRDALQREVARLTAAIEQLDSVLGRIGTAGSRGDAPAGAPTDASGTGSDAVDTGIGAPVTVSAATAEPVNPPAEVEPTAPATVSSRPRAARKAPAKKVARPRRTGTAAEPPKSIRVHVLEMLQAENRDFGLAEIIDRVHAAGIRAHDDAVRSITIKLMKDGRVERVGRGQYRLARRGASVRASAAVATAPRVTESAPEPPEVAPVPDAMDVPAPSTYPTTVRPESDSAPVPGPADPGFATEPGATAGAPSTEVEDRSAYAPSLNLGQPWNN